MKIGFIGLGNMATAMIGGMLGTGAFQAQEIIGSARTQETAEKVGSKYGILTGTDNRETARQANVLILAVKPVFLAEVIEQIRDLVDGESTLVISIAAGKTIDWIEHEFGKSLRIIRCMPNTPAMVGEGCTCVCLKETYTDAEVYAGDKAVALRIMNSFGRADILPERLMDASSVWREALRRMCFCSSRRWRTRRSWRECQGSRHTSMRHSLCLAALRWCLRPECTRAHSRIWSVRRPARRSRRSECWRRRGCVRQ